jgi:hypothetical protein
MCNTDLHKTIGENFEGNFRNERAPSGQTIHNLVKKT